MFKSRPSEVLFKKGTLQTRSKATKEQLRKSVISTKLLCNFIETTPTHGCAREYAAHSQNTLLYENTSGGLLLYVKRVFLFTVVKRNLLTLINK